MNIFKKHSMCIVGSFFLIVFLSGCQNMKGRDVGTLAGAGAGALAGSMIGGGSGQAIATVGGAVVGGVIGHQVGKGMEKKS